MGSAWLAAVTIAIRVGAAVDWVAPTCALDGRQWRDV